MVTSDSPVSTSCLLEMQPSIPLPQVYVVLRIKTRALCMLSKRSLPMERHPPAIHCLKNSVDHSTNILRGSCPAPFWEDGVGTHVVQSVTE